MVRLMTEQKESCMVVLDGIEIANGLANVHAGHSGVRERTVELKRLAREFDIPVLMTVDYSPGCRHIARDYEGVFKALPSGVEGLADTIIHIGRSLAQIGKSRTLSSEIAEIVIAKSGKNAPMAARLAFLADCQRFVDYVDL